MAETTITYDQEYGTVVTEAGRAAIATALAGNNPLDVAFVAFGDGNGSEYLPDDDQTSLKNEVHRSDQVSVYVDEANPSCLVVEASIPGDVGGWDLREAALLLANGSTIAVASLPTHPKPVIASGATVTTWYRMYFMVTTASAFVLKIDPNAEMTRAIVELMLKQHNEDPEAHGGNIRKAAAVAQTIFDFTMTRTDGAIELTVDGLPETPSSLITLRGIATADYVSTDSLTINGVPVTLYSPQKKTIDDGAWVDGAAVTMLWFVYDSSVFYQESSSSSSGSGNGNGSGNGDGSGGNSGGTTGSRAGWNVSVGDETPVSEGIHVPDATAPMGIVVDTVLELFAGSIRQVSTSGLHSLILLQSGVVLSFGSNEGESGSGQLGRTVNSGSSSATNIGVIPNLSGVIAIAAGDYHSLFLLSDGKVKSCGENKFGQLGRAASDNSTSATTPTVIPNLSGVIAIAAGGYHSLFLLGDGSVKSCGVGQWGQLGRVVSDGSASATNLGAIPDMPGVVAIAAGLRHSLFLLGDGSVKSCGHNEFGQLGRAASDNSTSATTPTVIPNLSGVVAIAAGGQHSLFHLSDGSVKSCGNNEFCQLGRAVSDGNASSTNLGSVSGLSAVADLAAGNHHSLFILSDGSVKSCGENNKGQLGRAVNSGSSSATNLGVIPSLSGVVGVAIGFHHSLFLLGNGSVKSCGRNDFGQLGRVVSEGSTSASNLGVIDLSDEVDINSSSRLPYDNGALLIQYDENSENRLTLFDDGFGSICVSPIKVYQIENDEAVEKTFQTIAG